jgi:hypothetical protein
VDKDFKRPGIGVTNAANRQPPCRHAGQALEILLTLDQVKEKLETGVARDSGGRFEAPGAKGGAYAVRPYAGREQMAHVAGWTLLQ